MTYNFDEPVLRRGTHSCKWDEAAPGELPMWVADMDFRTAPAVVEALRRRVDHGVFGYAWAGPEYYEALTRWFDTRHGWHIEPQSVVYTTGVVPALSAIIKALTGPGDRVLVQSPVYHCFFSSIRNNGCEAVQNRLVREGDTYRMDFEALERQAADPRVKVMILCNPHNPVGRVWKEEELRRVGDICLRHDVFVIADEIHCELVLPGNRYTPYATLGGAYWQHAAACISPTKAFNLAGLQVANIVVPDGETRRRVDRAININETCDIGPLGVTALIAAYNEGGDWLDQLNAYLAGNYAAMRRFAEERLPGLPLTRLEGTYLVWQDCTALGLHSAELEECLRREASLWLNAGSMYGEGGEGFMRWNIACPRSLLLDGLERFARFADGRRQAR